MARARRRTVPGQAGADAILEAGRAAELVPELEHVDHDRHDPILGHIREDFGLPVGGDLTTRVDVQRQDKRAAARRGIAVLELEQQIGVRVVRKRERQRVVGVGAAARAAPCGAAVAAVIGGLELAHTDLVRGAVLTAHEGEIVLVARLQIAEDGIVGGRCVAHLPVGRLQALRCVIAHHGHEMQVTRVFGQCELDVLPRPRRAAPTAARAAELPMPLPRAVRAALARLVIQPPA
eukprot:2681899-Prymnesium_polylepis.1